MNKLDVCLSLKLVENYDLNDTTIVIIDVVRASTTICTGIHYGLEHIVALADIDETIKLKQQGYIIAGERNGNKLEGFDFGNSPLDFTNRSLLDGKKLGITTTNGTRSLKIAEEKASKFNNFEILIGTFVNHSAISDYLSKHAKNVLLVCSGWKANLSIEDTVFAGGLASRLMQYGNYEFMSDGAAHAMLLYEQAKSNLFDFVIDNSARFRGRPNALIDDIRFCLRDSIIDTIPVVRNGKIVKI